MNTTVLQIPINPTLKKQAQLEAKRLGFSSLQDLLRLMMTQLVEKTIAIKITSTYPDEKLTPAQAAIILKKHKIVQEEMARGEYFTATNAEEMMQQLRS